MDLTTEINHEDERNNAVWEDFKTSFPHTFGNINYTNFDLPKGWVGIVREFAQKFDDNFPAISIVQVKQKLGHLRIYVDRDVMHQLPMETQADIHAFIMDVEEKVLNVCEECGSIGASRNSRPHVQNLCTKCNYERS